MIHWTLCHSYHKYQGNTMCHSYNKKHGTQNNWIMGFLPRTRSLNICGVNSDHLFQLTALLFFHMNNKMKIESLPNVALWKTVSFSCNWITQCFREGGAHQRTTSSLRAAGTQWQYSLTFQSWKSRSWKITEQPVKFHHVILKNAFPQ